MPPSAPTFSGSWDRLSSLYVAALRRKYEREVSPVREAGQAAPNPSAVRAEIRSTAGAPSFHAPTQGLGRCS
jgi:hypothetical protein